MGTTVAIWKWAGRGNNESAARVLEAILSDEAPPELARFDAEALQRDLEREFTEDGEPLLEIDRGDFAGHACNWLIITGGFVTMYAAMPRLVELSKARGAVVYDADEGRLVTAAAKYAAAAARPTPDQREKIDLQIVFSDHVAPAVERLGFRRDRRDSGRHFARGEEERRCTVSFPDDALTLMVCSVVFPQLAKFENRHRAFCQEPPLEQGAQLWEQISFAGAARPRFETPAERERFGVARAEMVARRAKEHFAKQPATLPELARAWESIGDPSGIKRAGVLWVLGERRKAREHARAKWKELDELLKVKYHPPSRSARIDNEFFQRFLDAEEASGAEPQTNQSPSPAT